MRFRILLALTAILPCVAFAQSSGSSEIEAVTRKLVTYFDKQLDTPHEYGNLALKEARMFPEGDIFAFVFPALGYAHIALADPAAKENSLKRMKSLIELCIPAVAAQLQARNRDLLEVKQFPSYATHLGQLNLILSYYRTLGGTDEKLLQLNDHLSGLLLAALEKSKGTPLPSYPQLTWPFDTIPCVLSLVLWKKEDDRVNAAKAAHLQWLRTEGLNKEYKLPFADIPGSRPRGCDLSLRIAMLSRLDENLAKQFYEEYRKQFWLSRGLLSGFAEWPGGGVGGADIDSGPVFMGIGMAATGNGFAVARAMGDTEILTAYNLQIGSKDILMAALEKTKPGLIKQSFKSMGLKFDPKYITGFLFGDAVLFGVITWPLPTSQP